MKLTQSLESVAAQHTPGPWWVTESGVRDSGGYIAHTRTATHYPGQDERYAEEVLERAANARLIASAPELLAACQAMIKYQELVESGATTGLIHAYAEAFEGAEAAIAKSLGQGDGI